jgi:hypothetical protein
VEGYGGPHVQNGCCLTAKALRQAPNGRQTKLSAAKSQLRIELVHADFLTDGDTTSLSFSHGSPSFLLLVTLRFFLLLSLCLP